MRIRILVYNTSAGEGRHHDFVQRLEGGRDGAIRVEIVCPGDAAVKGEDYVVHGQVCSAPVFPDLTRSLWSKQGMAE